MEINGNDLRIGNWIKDHTGLNNVVKIIGVGWVKFIDDEACAFDLCSGIPLTEELLLKMGFVRLNFGWIIDNGSRNEHGDIIHGDETFGLFDHSFGKLTNLKYNQYPVTYVHQLQNLYYALTGQELTLS